MDKLWKFILPYKYKKTQPLDFSKNIVYGVPTMSQTYQPKKKKRATTHGFLVRSETKSGRDVLKARRQKGRKRLTTV